MRTLAEIKQLTKRHYKQVVAFVMGVVFVFAIVAIRHGNIDYFSDEQNIVALDTETEIVDEAELEMATTSLPVQLRIPKINLETSFEKPLGLNHDGTIEVPDSYDEVAYYKYGPRPGEMGPSVILGHVDSFEGPAVLFSLGQLDKGDSIYIQGEDGDELEFKVTDLERHKQSSFPTEKVYGDIDHAGLRIITCSGIYDKGSFRYSHNLIVFAELVDEESE